MRLFIFILLFPFFATGQLRTFTPTQIDTNGVDMLRPFNGLIEFGNMHFIDYPTPGVTTNHPPDVYSRWKWCEIQTGADPNVNMDWTDLNSKFNNAIDRGQMIGVGFEIMSDAATCNTVGGKVLSYPVAVHNAEQAETNKDWTPTHSTQWVHNWNSYSLHVAWRAFLQSIANHLANTSHAGRTYVSILSYVDDRGFGNYGEHHLYGAGRTNGNTIDAAPTGTALQDSSYQILSDAHKQAFPNTRIIMNINALNGGNSGSDVSAASGYYLLNASNNVGPYGMRWDHVTDAGTFNYDYTTNTTTFNGLNFKNAIATRYMVAPVIGEPQQFNYSAAGQCDYAHVMTEITTYHASNLENANIVNAASSCVQNGFRSYAKRMGYRYTILNGQMTDSLIRNGNFHIQWNGSNIGIAPTYQSWTSTYEFRQSGVVKFSYTSTFHPFMLLPGSFTVIDNQILPAILSGVYDLYLIIRDPNGYRTPMPLQITGRGSDGAYLLRSGIAIATQGTGPPPPPPPPPNQPPVVFAGSDQTDTLPKNVDTLQGIVSDPNNDVLTLSWTQLSGPNTAIMVSPTATLNRITGLIEGTYTFRLTANDGHGGITSDDVTVFVFNVITPPPPPPPPPTYSPPTVTAGADTIIQLPADSAILRGHVTHKDTLIQSALWVKFSGIGGVIVTPNDSTTRVTGLTAGFYQYRFRITDKAGNIVDDYMTVQVIPVVPVTPPPLPARPYNSKVSGIKNN